MTLDKQREVWYYNRALNSCITCGGVAHLGERLNGIQEVVGSIPIISTRKKHDVSRAFLFCPADCMFRWTIGFTACSQYGIRGTNAQLPAAWSGPFRCERQPGALPG